jgi:chromate reductase
MAALRAAQERMPEGMAMEIFDLATIPLYNGDVEMAGIPDSVQQFKAKIKQADGLLIATPEYNYSVSGVLKNAIDWASRPPRDTPLPRKPAAIMGASMGVFGTARAQYDLRKICVCLNVFVLNRPEVFIATAQDKFDAAGQLTDEETGKHIRKLLEAFQGWILKVGSRE